jgi:hypothetical protein
MHPGYVRLSNGQCCDNKIRAGLGMRAGLAAWWQHNRAAGNDVITVGAITGLPIPVCTPRVMHPVRHVLAPEWPGEGFEGGADPWAATGPVVSARWR